MSSHHGRHPLSSPTRGQKHGAQVTSGGGSSAKCLSYLLRAFSTFPDKQRRVSQGAKCLSGLSERFESNHVVEKKLEVAMVAHPRLDFRDRDDVDIVSQLVPLRSGEENSVALTHDLSQRFELGGPVSR